MNLDRIRSFIQERRVLLIYISIAVASLALITVVIVLAVSKKEKAEVKKAPRIISITIDAPDEIPLEEKELIVYESLLKAGYSSAGACGIMGNIAVESPDYDPSAVNESSGALGLFQWNDVGDRQQHFKDFCREQKMNWNSIEAQLAFAVYELSGADPIACRLDDFLKETDNSYAAASEFAAGFERCISESGKSEDIYAGSLYPEFYGEHYQGLAKRINKAMNYYNRFSDEDDTEADREINITIE
ncbi:MAG: hypothetical protein K6F73_09655 [Lachnospiraceae bacterium]|nr:hypothetical protein [Lachnospiraceae bacterium]